MNRYNVKYIFFLIIFLNISTHTEVSSKSKLPVVDGKEVVATVNGEPIFLDVLNKAIADAHSSKHDMEKAGRVDYSGVMRRLINTRLILLEAGNIGFDELPEIQNLVEQYSKEALIEILLEKHVRNIQPDEKEVEERYKEIIREWQIKSASFKNEEAIIKAEAEVKAGKDFDEVMKKAVAAGIAEFDEESQYLKDTDLTAPIARMISEIEIGSVSPIISVGTNRFLLFKLEGIRYPEVEDVAAKQRARREVLDQARVQAARNYVSDLKKKYLTLNGDLFDSLDYESPEPGIDNLLKDDRVIAEIKGGESITVGYFTGALKKKYYHGIEHAIERKEVNKRKREILEDLLQRRVLLKEALQQQMDKTEQYQGRVFGYKDSLIFGAFVQKVVSPEVTLDAAELKSYYDQNIETYNLPAMMRIKSIVFGKQRNAEDAMEKLLDGADFEWVRSHVEGTVDGNMKGLLNFDGKLLTVSGLPEGVQKTVSGANPGAFRLYESAEGHFYVLYIYHVVPSKPKPFDEVKETIAETVYLGKQKKILETWADKLKEYYPVEIYRKDLK